MGTNVMIYVLEQHEFKSGKRKLYINYTNCGFNILQNKECVLLDNCQYLTIVGAAAMRLESEVF